MERQFTLYEITTPFGRSYIGITSQSLKERLRQHTARAKTAPIEHPFYADIRKCEGKWVEIKALANVGNIFKAREAEKAEILSRRDENLYNLSNGGELDAGTGGRVFYERLNANPSAREEYLKKLSDRKKENDWSDYDNMGKASAQWRKDHPREAYKQAYRAARIARKNAHKNEVKHETKEQRKKRLQYKFDRGAIARENAKKQWAKKTPEELSEIKRKLSESAKKRMSELTVEQKKALTEKARATRLRKRECGDESI